MVKVQLTLTDNENTIVELFKVRYKLKDKREAIKEMIKMFKVDFKITIREKPVWHG